MNEKNDGGAAFPGEQGLFPEGTWNQTWEPGMSLRDFFAAAILTGILAASNEITMETEVRRAYKYADLMLLEKKRREHNEST